MKNILVLCTGNSCRSQMAHGYLNLFASNSAIVYSAGIETHGIYPGAASIMKEDGVDISNNTSNHVDEYENIDFDFINKHSIPILYRNKDIWKIDLRIYEDYKLQSRNIQQN